MSTPPTVVRSDNEKVKRLLDVVKRHRGGLDQALDELERHVLGSPTEEFRPEPKQQPG